MCFSHIFELSEAEKRCSVIGNQSISKDVDNVGSIDVWVYLQFVLGLSSVGDFVWSGLRKKIEDLGFFFFFPSAVDWWWRWRFVLCWVWVAMFGYQETLRKSRKFVWIYYFIVVDIGSVWIKLIVAETEN